MIAESRKNSHNGDGGLQVADISASDLKRVYRLLTGELYVSSMRGTDFGFLTDWMEQTESGTKLGQMEFKRAIERAVSRANRSPRESGLPEKFWIVNVNREKKRQAARYALRLPPGAIHLLA